MTEYIDLFAHSKTKGCAQRDRIYRSLRLTKTIVCAQGAGDLAGFAGKMEITIESGKHSCEFEYHSEAV